MTQPHPHPVVVRESSAMTRWLAIVLLVVAGALIFTVVQQRTSGTRRAPTSFTPRAITPPPDKLGADELATIDVFGRLSPSVVHVTSLETRRDRFSMDVTDIPQGSGSGFLWDEAGHVVTNFHVVQHADRAKVMLSDNTVYDATIIGTAPDKDIAILQIDHPPTGLPPIPLGTSSDLRVGQKVLAIGNPFGLDQTLTTGVISGLGREIKSVTNRPISDVIQTDAPINPGNSGGPLLDSSGRLIGINTAIYSPSGAFAGIGFAVPVDTINNIVPQLLQHGRVVRPGLGIKTATDQLAGQLRVKGVLIVDVMPGGAADSAGLVGTTNGANGSWVLGDIIVAMDGDPIQVMNDLYRALDSHKVGDKVKVSVVKGGKRRDVDVTLQPLP